MAAMPAESGKNESDRAPLERWVPETCRRDGQFVLESSEGQEGSTDAAWNRHYLAGIEAIRTGDLDAAHLEFCAGALLARAFGARDWRFAETLDELGLVAYLDGDHERAESMQSLAVVEMLLSRGPGSAATPGISGKPSSVAIYVARLQHLYESQGRADQARKLGEHPYLLLEQGMLPLDAALAHRLDWLVSEYLLAENFSAAERLSELRARLLAD